MPNLFANQRADEQIRKVIRRHPVIFISETLFILVLLIVGIVGIVLGELGYFGNQPQLVGVAISFYLFFIWFLYLVFFINFYYDVTIITNERLVEIAQKGLFAREESEITLDHVQDVTARQSGVLETLFDYGTVVVETAGEGTGPSRIRGREAIFELENIPKPNEIARLITNLHAEHIAPRPV